MNKIALALLILLTAASCSRRVAPVAEVRDSVVHRVVEYVHDKDVALEPDSALIRALLACDSLGNVYLHTIETLQGERLRQSLRLIDNVLKVTATDQARERHYIHHIGEEIVRYREVPVPVPLEVNRLSTWQAFQIWIGRLAMILMILLAGWRIFKTRINLII